MDAVERLVATEEIKGLKGRYQRAVDAGRWDEFEECLTEDFFRVRRRHVRADSWP
jgi:SnoaL-like domain